MIITYDDIYSHSSLSVKRLHSRPTTQGYKLLAFHGGRIFIAAKIIGWRLIIENSLPVSLFSQQSKIRAGFKGSEWLAVCIAEIADIFLQRHASPKTLLLSISLFLRHRYAEQIFSPIFVDASRFRRWALVSEQSTATLLFAPITDTFALSFAEALFDIYSNAFAGPLPGGLSRSRLDEPLESSLLMRRYFSVLLPQATVQLSWYLRQIYCRHI